MQDAEPFAREVTFAEPSKTRSGPRSTALLRRFNPFWGWQRGMETTSSLAGFGACLTRHDRPIVLASQTAFFWPAGRITPHNLLPCMETGGRLGARHVSEARRESRRRLGCRGAARPADCSARLLPIGLTRPSGRTSVLLGFRCGRDRGRRGCPCPSSCCLLACSWRTTGPKPSFSFHVLGTGGFPAGSTDHAGASARLPPARIPIWSTHTPPAEEQIGSSFFRDSLVQPRCVSLKSA